MSSKTIKVEYLARVEGEGGLTLRIKGAQVRDVKLRIFEPPRFFEAFLQGRHFDEVPDITARICGICPVAYQMSAAHALEAAFGVRVEGPLRQLRRLLYCGEWIESHVLHVYMLHAPDFLGFEDVVGIAREHPGVVERALRLKKLGNQLVTLVGGREIHPINVRVGGFYKIPSKREFRALAEPFRWAREAAIETVRWAATLPYPDFERDYEFVSLRHPGEYPFSEGNIVSNRGVDIPAREFEEHFIEEHVEHSTSLHGVRKDGGAYFVGPLARFNLNADRLTPLARETAREVGFAPGCRNPFKSLLARCVETLHACDEALGILETFELPDAPAVAFEPREGVGHGCTEAPRGILYHRYGVGADGLIREARIVPPTAQNQRCIEEDLREVAEKNIELDTERLTWLCEQSIRNYDPCISCATHFLRLKVEREEEGNDA